MSDDRGGEDVIVETEQLKTPVNPLEKWLLVCGRRGLFLGTDRVHAYFALVNSNGAVHAPVFDTPNDALGYGYQHLNGGYHYDYLAVPIILKKGQEYAHILDIINAGFGNLAGDMFCNLPGYSEKRPQ